MRVYVRVVISSSSAGVETRDLKFYNDIKTENQFHISIENYHESCWRPAV